MIDKAEPCPNLKEDWTKKQKQTNAAWFVYFIGSENKDGVLNYIPEPINYMIVFYLLF